METFIYLVCLGVGLLFTVVSAVLGHAFGGGHHAGDIGSGGHAEAGADGTDGPGVSAFSPTVIASFVTSFGGFGLIFSRISATSSPAVSAPLAVVTGMVTATGVLWLLRQLISRTQSSSEGKIGSLVGTTATIITPISEGGVGEIAYVQNGTRYTAPARLERGGPVGNGKLVKISRIVGSQFYVVPD